MNSGQLYKYRERNREGKEELRGGKERDVECERKKKRGVRER